MAVCPSLIDKLRLYRVAIGSLAGHVPVDPSQNHWRICFLQYGSEVRHRRECMIIFVPCSYYQMIFEVPSTFLIGPLRWGTCDRQTSTETCSASIPNSDTNVHKPKSRRAESSACSSLVAGNRARKCFLGPPGRLMLRVFSLCCCRHLTCAEENNVISVLVLEELSLRDPESCKQVSR
jgi:hypothetical protein